MNFQKAILKKLEKDLLREHPKKEEKQLIFAYKNLNNRWKSVTARGFFQHKYIFFEATFACMDFESVFITSKPNYKPKLSSFGDKNFDQPDPLIWKEWNGHFDENDYARKITAGLPFIEHNENSHVLTGNHHKYKI